MKSKTWMYITSAVTGGAIALMGEYSAVPWYWRYPAYFVLGVIIAIAWKLK